MERLGEFQAVISQLQACLSRRQAKSARMMELIKELQSLGVTEVGGWIQPATRKLHKRTIVLSHKVKAGEMMKAKMDETRKIPDNLKVLLVRMLEVANLGEQTADDTIAALEREVIAPRGLSLPNRHVR